VIHSLSDAHKAHLQRVGIESPPDQLEIGELEYDMHFFNWKATGPYAPDHMLHERVLASVAWSRQCAKDRAAVKFTQELPKQWPVTEKRVEFHVEKESKFWKIIAFILLATLLVLLFSSKGHAQFSHVNYVNFQSSGTNITGAFFTSPFNINCVTNLTCTVSGNTLSISAAGGAGSGCIPPGSTPNALLFDAGSGACNDVTKWTSNGTTTITGAATGILDLSAIATLKIPTAAGCAPTVSSLLCYDSTNNKFTFGQNGSTVSFGLTGSCTNQAITATLATGPPTCSTITSSFVDTSVAITGADINTSSQVTSTHITGGTNTDLATFNATGNLVNYGGVTCTNQVLASLSAAGLGGCHTIVSADLNITSTTCTNQFLTVISSTGVGTCTTDTLASAQHANQGTTTTVLHGNAAGNPSFGSVVSADLNITPTTCTNQVITAISSAVAGTCTTVTSSFTSGTFPANAHNLLSATHGDTTASSAVRGGGIFAIGASPLWTQVAHSSATGGYFKWNGTDIVASTGAAAGTGSCSASNWVNTENADAAPTCSQPNFTDLAGSIAVGQTPLTTRGDLLTVNVGGALSRVAIGANTNCLTSNGTDPVWATCGGGSGTINAATQFAAAYYSSSGSATTISGVAPPTAQNVPYVLVSTPSAGVATAPTFSLPGVPIDPRSTTTEAVLNTDREEILTMSNSGATGLSIAQAGTGNFTNSFNFGVFNINTGLVTLTPTTSMINGNASQIIPNHWMSLVYSDNSNYRALTAPDIAAFPNCTDATGNHLNFTSATGAFSCGTSINTQYTKLRCEPGLGDGLNAITAGTYLQSTCYNDSGVTWTITGIKCFTDNSGTSTLNAAGNTLGALLTGAVTCSSAFAAGTQSANVALTSGDYIKFTFVADGTSKQTTWVVSMTQ
jgi:hypothetical protein